MWLITPRGFYSAVEKHEDVQGGMVTVRARAKRDLDNLADLLPNAKPYQEDRYSDYPWRIRVEKEEWALAVAEMAREIDYHNFKDRIHQIDHHRAGVYARIWGVLLDLEVGKRWRGWSGTNRSAGTRTFRSPNGTFDTFDARTSATTGADDFFDSINMPRGGTLSSITPLNDDMYGYAHQEPLFDGNDDVLSLPPKPASNRRRNRNRRRKS